MPGCTDVFVTFTSECLEIEVLCSDSTVCIMTLDRGRALRTRAILTHPRWREIASARFAPRHGVSPLAYERAS